jgi:hypothetical protein
VRGSFRRLRSTGTASGQCSPKLQAAMQRDGARRNTRYGRDFAARLRARAWSIFKRRHGWPCGKANLPGRGCFAPTSAAAACAANTRRSG